MNSINNLEVFQRIDEIHLKFKVSTTALCKKLDTTLIGLWKKYDYEQFGIRTYFRFLGSTKENSVAISYYFYDNGTVKAHNPNPHFIVIYTIDSDKLIPSDIDFIGDLLPFDKDKAINIIMSSTLHATNQE